MPFAEGEALRFMGMALLFGFFRVIAFVYNAVHGEKCCLNARKRRKAALCKRFLKQEKRVDFLAATNTACSTWALENPLVDSAKRPHPLLMPWFRWRYHLMACAIQWNWYHVHWFLGQHSWAIRTYREKSPEKIVALERSWYSTLWKSSGPVAVNSAWWIPNHCVKTHPQQVENRSIPNKIKFTFFFAISRGNIETSTGHFRRFLRSEIVRNIKDNTKTKSIITRRRRRGVLYREIADWRWIYNGDKGTISYETPSDCIHIHIVSFRNLHIVLCPWWFIKAWYKAGRLFLVTAEDSELRLATQSMFSRKFNNSAFGIECVWHGRHRWKLEFLERPESDFLIGVSSTFHIERGMLENSTGLSSQYTFDMFLMT